MAVPLNGALETHIAQFGATSSGHFDNLGSAHSGVPARRGPGRQMTQLDEGAGFAALPGFRAGLS
jgi:hypothetical protein